MQGNEIHSDTQDFICHRSNLMYASRAWSPFLMNILNTESRFFRIMAPWLGLSNSFVGHVHSEISFRASHHFFKNIERIQW